MVGANESTAGWPACGEIDTVEALGQQPQSIEQHAHWGPPTQLYGQGWRLPDESIAGWHVYTLVWSPSKIQWKVDGETTLTLTAAHVGSDWVSSFEHPFALRLDLQVGGWAGTPKAASEFPAKMLVDWVRVTAESIP
jgi:beta-glucanase (GH16 family)